MQLKYNRYSTPRVSQTDRFILYFCFLIDARLIKAGLVSRFKYFANIPNVSNLLCSCGRPSLKIGLNSQASLFIQNGVSPSFVNIKYRQIIATFKLNPIIIYNICLYIWHHNAISISTIVESVYIVWKNSSCVFYNFSKLLFFSFFFFEETHTELHMEIEVSVYIIFIFIFIGT